MVFILVLQLFVDLLIRQNSTTTILITDQSFQAKNAKYFMVPASQCENLLLTL